MLLSTRCFAHLVPPSSFFFPSSKEVYRAPLPAHEAKVDPHAGSLFLFPPPRRNKVQSAVSIPFLKITLVSRGKKISSSRCYRAIFFQSLSTVRSPLFRARQRSATTALLFAPRITDQDRGFLAFFYEHHYAEFSSFRGLEGEDGFYPSL